MSGPLLVIGDIVGGAYEVLETATALGYEPTNVVWEVRRGTPLYRTITVTDVTPAEAKWPAIIVGTRVFDDLRNRRVDFRWCESTWRVRLEMEQSGVANWVSIVHPTAHLSPTAAVGVGVFIGPNASVSSYCEIGDFVRVGRSTSVGHHSRIGDYSRIAPGVTIPGHVTIGSQVVVGPGASFVNDLVITDHVLIGAGAVVTRHITKPLQVVGNPARPLRRPLAIAKRAARKIARSLIGESPLFRALRHRYRTGEWR